MKTVTKIVLPKLTFPKNVIQCSAVRLQQDRAKEASKSLQASLHAKYLFTLVSGKTDVLPGKLALYWEAIQQVLELRVKTGVSPLRPRRL